MLLRVLAFLVTPLLVVAAVAAFFALAVTFPTLGAG
jgi:hypothetical protein